MRAKLMRIGNSRRVQLPKPLILEAGLGEDVDLDVQDRTIVIRPVGTPRQSAVETWCWCGSTL